MKRLVEIVRICLFAVVITPIANTAFASDDYLYRASCPQASGQVDQWRFFKCECTSFVASRLNRDGIAFSNHYKGPRWSHAKYWKGVAQRLGIAVDTTPRPGDVAWWDNGEHGHVAYVDSVNADGTVNISEYNYQRKHDYGTRRVRAKAYIHFGGSLTVQDLWVKSNAPIYAGERNGFDAQFKLKNNSRQTVTVAKVAMSIHQSNHKHVSDMKVINNVRIPAGHDYHMQKTIVNSPATPGQYKVVAKIYQNGQWKDLASTPFTVIKAKVTTPTLNSVELIAPTSLNENSCTNLTVVGKFSDGSRKALSPYSWREYSSATTINSSGRLCASNVTRDERIMVRAYVRYDGKSYSPSQYLTAKNLGGGVTLKSIKLQAPATLNENSCTNLSVVGEFSDGSRKALSPYSWREYSSATTINSSGRLCASSVTRDERAKVKAYVRYDGKYYYPYQYVTVRNGRGSPTPKPSPTPPGAKTPSRIYIYGCSSITEGRYCSYKAKVYYTNGTRKYVSGAWTDDSRYAYFRSSRLYASNVSRNQYVNIRVSYTENRKTVTRTKRVKIRNR